MCPPVLRGPTPIGREGWRSPHGVEVAATADITLNKHAGPVPGGRTWFYPTPGTGVAVLDRPLPALLSPRLVRETERVLAHHYGPPSDRPVHLALLSEGRAGHPVCAFRLPTAERSTGYQSRARRPRSAHCTPRSADRAPSGDSPDSTRQTMHVGRAEALPSRQKP